MKELFHTTGFSNSVTAHTQKQTQFVLYIDVYLNESVHLSKGLAEVAQQHSAVSAL